MKVYHIIYFSCFMPNKLHFGFIFLTLHETVKQILIYIYIYIYIFILFYFFINIFVFGGHGCPQPFSLHLCPLFVL